MSGTGIHNERSGADQAQDLLARIEHLKAKLVRMPAGAHAYERNTELHAELDRLLAEYMRMQLRSKAGSRPKD